MPADRTPPTMFFGRIANLLFYLLIMAIAGGLKLHYSHAGSDMLDWILGPTAALTEIISGIPFDFEPLTGYISRDARAIIAPACAGVNFLIMAFAMTAFHGIPRLTTAGGKLAWLTGTLLGAYLVTVGINSLRIIAAIHLYGSDIYSGPLTPRSVHRAAGVCIYFAALSTLYLLSNKIAAALVPAGCAPTASDRNLQTGLCNSFIPFYWYAAVTLGIPLLHHRELAGNLRFQQHLLTVGAVCGVFLIIFLIGQLCYQYVKKPGPEDHALDCPWKKLFGIGLNRRSFKGRRP